MDNLIMGRVEVLQKDVPYIADPLPLFSDLTDHGQRKYTLLLESVEIDSKRHTRSLLLLNSALEIRGQGMKVSVTALTDNGMQLLDYLSEELPQGIEQYHETNKLILVFPDGSDDLNEDQRLKGLTPIQILRTVVQRVKSTRSVRDAVFLGGIFAYDFIASFENLPDVDEGLNPCPDMLFYLAETTLVVDHIRKTCRLQHSVFGGVNYSKCYNEGYNRLAQYESKIKRCDGDLPVVESVLREDTIRVNVSDEEFCQQVTDLKKNIIEGEVFQVVPSRCFSVPCADSIQAYQQLRVLNPSPYMFYLNDPEFVLFGASPESALSYKADCRQVSVYPIAGTRKRGKKPDGEIDPDYDSRIELELRTDEKEVAEHLMLVDLARNDIARISTNGSRHVANLLKVDRYSHVMHLVSRVVGTLRDDLDAMHAYQACMNMGTLVGAPKIRAAQLIREVEKTRRGSYGGAIGYLNGAGDMDTCIVIRSACVLNGIAYIQAGAGVVYDSDPHSEAEETRSKAQAVIQAVIQANEYVKSAQFEVYQSESMVL